MSSRTHAGLRFIRDLSLRANGMAFGLGALAVLTLDVSDFVLVVFVIGVLWTSAHLAWLTISARRLERSGR